MLSIAMGIIIVFTACVGTIAVVLALNVLADCKDNGIGALWGSRSLVTAVLASLLVALLRYIRPSSSGPGTVSEPVAAAVVFSAGALVALIVIICVCRRYRYSRSHRNGAQAAWGPWRWLVVALVSYLVLVAPVAAAAHWTAPWSAYLTRSVALTLAFMLTPVAANAVVIAVRALICIWCRRRQKFYNPLLRWRQKFYQKNAQREFPPTRVFRRYSWAVPTREALDLIASCAPLVEVGAGTGYWAWLLRQLNVEIVAYDGTPGVTVGNRHHLFAFSWLRVRKADAAEAAARHSDRTMLICWPPAETDMSSRALASFTGDTVIYIGARNWEYAADTGNEQFHAALKQNWKLEQQLDLPSWGSIRDAVRIYKRLGQ